MSYYTKVIAGFILLDLYLNVLIAQTSQFWLQVLFIILFFPLIKGILLVTKLNTINQVGIQFHPKWCKNLFIGFTIGFTFWLIKYIITFLCGGLTIQGVMPFPQMILNLAMVVLTFFIGSFFNDIIIRGYVFGHLKYKLSGKLVFIISLTLYTIDDFWNEGFSISNVLFSLILGLSLTYAIYRTGSIWANTGIHWGLNVCYGLFNGTLGQSDAGIILTEFQETPTLLVELVGFTIPLIMFGCVFLLRDRFHKVT